MKTRLFLTLFFSITVANKALADETSQDCLVQLSTGFHDDYIAGTDDGRYTEIFYDGNIVPFDARLKCDRVEAYFRTVSGADNMLGGKPLLVAGGIDYTLFRFHALIDWELSTGFYSQTLDTSDNYRAPISSDFEGTFLNFGVNAQGQLPWLQNAYVEFSTGYTHSMSENSESSAFFMTGAGFDQPLPINFKDRPISFSSKVDFVWTGVLNNDYTRVEYGVSLPWNEHWSFGGPTIINIFPVDGKSTSSTQLFTINFIQDL